MDCAHEEAHQHHTPDYRFSEECRMQATGGRINCVAPRASSPRRHGNVSLAVVARWGWRTVDAAGNTVKQMDFDV
jgi:hypothetical protein